MIRLDCKGPLITALSRRSRYWTMRHRYRTLWAKWIYAIALKVSNVSCSGLSRAVIYGSCRPSPDIRTTTPQPTFPA